MKPEYALGNVVEEFEPKAEGFGIELKRLIKGAKDKVVSGEFWWTFAGFV